MTVMDYTAGPSEEYSVVDFAARLWTRKFQILLFGLAMTLLVGTHLLLHPKPHHLQALLRIESQTGTPDNKDLNLEAETHNLTSRSMIDQAVQTLGPRVDILQGNSWLGRWLSAHFRTQQSYKFPIRYDGLTLEELHVPADLFDTRLVLTIGEGGRYTLADPDGKILADDHALTGAYAPDPADPGADAVHIAISHLTAVPGTSYVIISYLPQSLISSLQNHLKAEVLTRKENYGFIQLSYDCADTIFASHFMDALLADYIRHAYDGTSISKIQALTRMEEAIAKTEHALELAETNLSSFQQTHHTVDTAAETRYSMERLLDVQTQLSHLKAKRIEDGAYHTDANDAQRAMAGQIAQLEADNNRIQAMIAQMPETERQLYKLQRDVETLKQDYVHTSDKATELRNEVSGINAYARIVDPPTVIEAGRTSGAIKLLVISFIVGCGIGAIFVYYRHFSPFAQLRTAEQLRMATNLPLIGIVRKQKSRPFRRKSFEQRTLAAFSTELQVINRNIQFAEAPGDNNIRLFTGLGRHQGVTMIATHIAAANALSRKTILVDCNLLERHHNPYLHGERSPGLSDTLVDMNQLGSAIRTTEIKNLWFIPSGTFTTYGTQLLDRPSFRQLIEALSRMYECVILSYPALNDHPGCEAAVSMAGSVFFVARTGRNLESVRQALKSYCQLPNVKGVILNGAVGKAIA